MATVTGRKMGGYLIEKELGRGAMGVVFKARQLSMDRHVAIKFLPKRLAQDERIVARFDREARAAGRLSHPNLVNVHDAGVLEGLHFIAMEFVDGTSIHKRIRDKGPYPEKEALDIAAQVAEALKYAHNHGILHRDVKPDNFLVDASGRVRLADLGLAHFQEKDDKDASATRDGTTVGTPHYMSPEQCKGEAVDARSDIYSLGASLYVLTTGKPPFDGPTAAAVMVKALTEPPVQLKSLNPNLSNGFCNLVEKMIAKDPARRFQNAQELLDAIAKCKRGLYFRPPLKDTGKVEPASAVAPARHKWLLVGAAAALVVLGVVGFLLVGRGGKTDSADKPGPTAAAHVPKPADPAPAKTDVKEAAQTKTETPAKAERVPIRRPPRDDALGFLKPPADTPVMENAEEETAVRKLSALKVGLQEQLQRDPDAAIARMEEFLKLHRAPRIQNLAQEFLTRAKDAKESLDKDWAAAREAVEQDTIAGHKAAAFHQLRKFVDKHEGSKQAAAAEGMMLGLLADVRAEAAKLADAGQYDKAEDLLSMADSKLPEAITAPLRKDLERVQADREKARIFAESDRKQLTELHARAAAAARETDSVTGKRYDFTAAAKMLADGAPALRTPAIRKEGEGLADVYTRAARTLDRMRLALASVKTVPLQNLGSFKEPGELVGWTDKGLDFKPRELQAQLVPWKIVTGENLLEVAQAVKVAAGSSPTDLLDLGSLAFCANVPSVAAEKLLRAIAADAAAKPLAVPALRILHPGPTAEERSGQAKQLFAGAVAARENKEPLKLFKLQQRLLADFADTEFVKTHQKEIQDLLPGKAVQAPDKKDSEKKDPEKPKPDTPAARKDDEKKGPDDAVVAELKKFGWTDVHGNWAQDPKRRTAFVVIGGGLLTAPVSDGAVQVTFQLEEGASIGVYTRYLPESPATKELRATLASYDIILGAGYGVHCKSDGVRIYGDKTPGAIDTSTTRGTYEKRAVPMRLDSKAVQPGVHTASVAARGDKLDILFDGKPWRSADKLRAEGSLAIIIEGNAKVDSPMLGR
jgi:serine/threonine-protein kinase